VRSQFQTQRRLKDCKAGLAVEVPFDDATCYFLWNSERELQVVNVVLTRQRRTESISSTEVRAQEGSPLSLVNGEFFVEEKD
jgi:hypothetical protein